MTWQQIEALGLRANNAAKRGDEARRAYWRAKYEAALAAKTAK